MKNVILIFGVLFCSCFAFKKGTEDSNIAKHEILGRWCSASNTADYPHLTFEKNGYVIFDCKVDTVFGLKYSVQDNYLLVMPPDKPINKNKIFKLTQDSLVLGTLLELQAKQVYYRCDN